MALKVEKEYLDIPKEREYIRRTNAVGVRLWDKYQELFVTSFPLKEGTSSNDIPSNYLGKLLVYESNDSNMLIPRAFVRITEKIKYNNGNELLWVEYLYPYATSTFYIPHPSKPSSFKFRLVSDDEIRRLHDNNWSFYSSYKRVYNIEIEGECISIKYDKCKPVV